MSGKGLPNAADLMPEHGDKVYPNAGEEVTIEGKKQTLPAGITFKQAHDLSTNGNWRYTVLTKMRKEAGLI